MASDTGHVFTDALGIGMALAAVTVASRAGHGGQRTFGLYRLEILAALANSLLLLAVAVFVCWKAVGRIDNAPHIDPAGLVVAGMIGFGANLCAFMVLREGAAESVNVRGAHLEVLADLAGSAGTIVAAAVIATTGWDQIDTVVGVAIALFIVPRAIHLGMQALRILLQAAPPHLDVDEIEADLAAIPRVLDVHDLHVWTLTSAMDVASAHLTVASETDVHAVLDQARDLLKDRHQIAHATLQVEPQGHEGCAEVGW